MTSYQMLRSINLICLTKIPQTLGPMTAILSPAWHGSQTAETGESKGWNF